MLEYNSLFSFFCSSDLSLLSFKFLNILVIISLNISSESFFVLPLKYTECQLYLSAVNPCENFVTTLEDQFSFFATPLL